MIHEVNKEAIFNFLKEQSIVTEITNDEILILETQGKPKLKKVTFISLNKDSKYWSIDTESKKFSPEGNKVEKVIIEERKDDNILNIIMIELKSGHVNPTQINKKFSNSLSWVYLLLNLVHQKQKIQVFGILISQDKRCRWNSKSTLKLFSSTSIRYRKRSFYTKKEEATFSLKRIIKNKKLSLGT